MSVHEYRAGSWIAIVGEGAVALLHPDIGAPAARDLWRLTRTGSRLGTWVEHLAGRGIRTLPSFAMVEAHPSGLSVLVRGELTVQVGDQHVSGSGYTTWREAVLPGAAGFTITAAGEAGTSVPEWLPVAGGIVLASALRSTLERTHASHDNHAGLHLADEPEEDDLEVTLMQAPALAAAIGRPAADAPPADAQAADSPAPAGATGEVAQPEVAAEEVDPAEDAEYDHLFWSTEQLAAEEAERRAAALVDATPSSPDAAARQPEPPARPGAGGEPSPARHPATPSLGLETTRAPENEDEFAGPADDDAPGGAPSSFAPPVADQGPGAPAPAAPSRPPAPAGKPELISEVPWARPADDGDHDGHTVLPSELPALPQDDRRADEAGGPAEWGEEPVLELVLSTGPRIEVTRPVLLGRAPESSRFRGGDVPRLVTVANPERDVSGTHVEVRPAGDHVVVTDMNSTNGTVVVLPGQPSFRLHPGTGVPVPPGGVVELGTGVSITVVRTGEDLE